MLERWFAAIHPDDRERVEATRRGAVEAGVYECEFRVLDVGGAVRRIWMRAWRVGGTHELQEWDGVATDVTERRALEEEARAARRRLEDMLASMNDALVEYELAPEQPPRVTYASVGLARLLGAETLALDRAGHASTTEYRLIGVDQRVRRVLARAQPRRHGGILLASSVLANLSDQPRSHDPEARPLARTMLTPRQLEVLGLLGEGLRTKAIADRLQISPATVRNHVTAIMAALDSRSRIEAVVTGRRLGLL
jgi:DNA-binding CsgD family transcriptional regulator